MTDPAQLVLLAMASLVLPGLLAFFAAKRLGLQIVWAALILGAGLGIYGWIETREPLFGAAAMRRSVSIYFVLLPGFVGITLGAAIGALVGRFRQPH
ncbi:MAG: hypothetical protein Q4G36_09760 [Paracoccus sp. (in: a-proteobacteria)]|nr:hypothetical protein [Paracoccus sp. (in: a-proteobacteria)]